MNTPVQACIRSVSPSSTHTDVTPAPCPTICSPAPSCNGPMGEGLGGGGKATAWTRPKLIGSFWDSRPSEQYVICKLCVFGEDLPLHAVHLPTFPIPHTHRCNRITTGSTAMASVILFCCARLRCCDATCSTRLGKNGLPKGCAP
jgi:hypothetical protein